MLKQEELEKSPLFRDIGYDDYLRMLSCFQAVQRTFRPDDLIYDLSAMKNNAVGIVERGTAALIRIDEAGVSTVLEELTTGGVFGRSLAFAGAGEDSLEVVCRTPCDVLFIDYPHILKRCEKACTYHSLLVQNMLRLMSEKAQALSRRVDVLSRRSIREKLSEQEVSRSFTLPFSLSMLADYIATDRSAMMRELKKMRQEELVDVHGRKVLLQQGV